MKYAGITNIFVVVLLLSLFSCNLKPDGEDLSARKYDFAVGILNAFFIFPDRLPATIKEFYSFPSPELLYESVKEQYTRYFNSEDAKIISYYLSTERYGIGIECEYAERGFVIKYVWSDSPGEKAGLEPSDTILSVDGESVEGMNKMEFESMLSGVDGSAVVLGVKRGEDQINKKVVYGLFKEPTVIVEAFDSSVVLIILKKFLLETNTPGGSAVEFAAALDSTKWADYTILDLRENGGGRLDQCLDIIGMLVPPGTEIINTIQRRYNKETKESFFKDSTYFAKGTGIAADRTIYVLVDYYTASASEILVSCIMQRPKVTVIGEVTFGKARGQVYDWGPDSVFAKVTAMTMTPAGNSAVSYDSVGIIPDVLTSSEGAYDTAIDMIYETSSSRKRIVTPGKPGRLERDVPRHRPEPMTLIPAREW